MAGLYDTDGRIRVTLVTGSSYVGAYAADGSLNIQYAPGTGYVGRTAPSGAMYVTEYQGTGPAPLYAPDGSIYFTNDPTNFTGALRTVGGALTVEPDPFELLVASSAVAYGLRRLRTNYTGPAIRVRRTSDNAEADIGFAANGSLNVAALLAHCGGSSGFVRTWYDQDLAGNHATQTDPALQPAIVTAGALVTEAGRPVIDGAGGKSLVFPRFSIRTWNVMATPAGTLLNDTLASPGRIEFNPTSLLYRGSGIIPFTISPAVSGMNIISIIPNNTAIQGWLNGVNIGSAANSTVRTLDRLVNGRFAELIAYTFEVSATDRQLLERNQGSYFGITTA